MRPVLLDTDILSLFFRKHPQIVIKFNEYLEEHERINFSIITYYEIISGLKYKNAHKQIDGFLNFAKLNNILPLTIRSVALSADIYAKLRKQGELIDDADILIAGIALADSLTLITNNEKHFKRIDSLKLQNWI